MFSSTSFSNPYTVNHKNKHDRRDSLELPLYTITTFDHDHDIDETIITTPTMLTTKTAIVAPTVALANLDLSSPALHSYHPNPNSIYNDSLSLPRTIFPHSPRTTALFLTNTPSMPPSVPSISLKERFLSVLQFLVKWGSILGLGYAGYMIIKEEIIKQSVGGADSASVPLMGIVIVVCAAVVFAALINIGRVVVGGWREYRRVVGWRRRRDEEEEIAGDGGIRLEGVAGWWGRGTREEEEGGESMRTEMASRGRRKSCWQRVGGLMERIDEEDEEIREEMFEELEEMEDVVDEKMGLLEAMSR